MSHDPRVAPRGYILHPMASIRRGSCLAVVLVICVSGSALADEVSDSRKLQAEALDAFHHKEYGSFLEKIRRASSLRPQHPSMLYQLATAYALNDQPDAALDDLERVAAMGFIYPAEDDPNLSALRASPRFGKIVASFRRNAQPVGSVRRAFTVAQSSMIAEGLAYDPASRRFFVSDVRHRAIYSTGEGQDVTAFATNLPLGPFGMSVDTRRGILWVAASGVPQVEGLDRSMTDHAALLKIDLATGRLLKTFAPHDDLKHLFGDVTVARSGDVFVTDSISPIIFRLRHDRFMQFARGPFTSLQGLAEAYDGSSLYVSDYTRGLYTVDLRTGESRALPVPANISLLGIDGLYLIGQRTLVGIQNGTNPNRVIRIQLTAGALSVSDVQTLAANADGMADLTLATKVGKFLYFNANGQWEQFDDEGHLKAGAKLERLRVLAVPLSP
jgi:hypothetical protein